MDLMALVLRNSAKEAWIVLISLPNVVSVQGETLKTLHLTFEDLTQAAEVR